MTVFLKKHWFFVGMILVALCAYGLRDHHAWVRKYNILPIGIFTIPFSLKLLIGGGGDVNLPVLNMLSSLVITVLVPIVLGNLTQSRLEAHLSRFKQAFSVFQQCIVLLIISNAVAVSETNIREASMNC